PGGQEQSVLAPGPLVSLVLVQCCSHRRQLHRYVRVEYPCGRTIVSMSLAYGRVVGFLLCRSRCRSFVFFVHVWRVSASCCRNLVVLWSWSLVLLLVCVQHSKETVRVRHTVSKW